MAKKLDSFLYVCLYVALYMVARAISAVFMPLLSAVKLFLSGERSFTYLVNYFVECLKYCRANTLMQSIAAMLLALLFIWFVFLIRKRKISSVLFGKKLYFREVAAAILISFALSAVAALVMKIPFPSGIFEAYEGHMSYGQYQNFWVMLLVSGIIAPIFEEIFFRGVIYSEARKSGGFLYSNLLQSLVFGILHLNIIQGFYAFFVGFSLGCVLNLRKSIYLCMLIHILFNLSNLLFGGYISAVSGTPYFIVCGICAMVIGFLLLIRRK